MTATPSAGMQVDCYVLEFTGHPPSPNDRLHWRQRAKLTKHWRSSACIRANMQEIPHFERIRICASIVRRSLGTADEDNDRARLKPIIDGLVDAGVVSNDTRGQIEWGTVTEQRGPKGVYVFVQPIEAVE